MRFNELVPILQVAIGPVLLISGVGLLLLSMTNRFGRVVDRSRSLVDAVRRGTPQDRARLTEELRILYGRARVIRKGITYASSSVLLAAILIIALFLTALFQLETALPIIVLFGSCMASLIASLILFIQDMKVSLAALKLEIKSAEEPRT